MDSLFLPFASLKELLRSYGAEESPTALRQWAEENHLSPGEAATRLLRDRGAVALFGQHAILQMRSGSRTTPYGYARRDGVVVVEPVEANTVASFFRRYREGMSLRQIAEVANQQGIPTSRGGQWQASTIRHILRNPNYVGQLRRNNMVRDGGPPGLIDPELFKAVQKGLTRRAKRAGKAIREGPFSPSI
ncbi:MAG: recombinase family protein [Thermoplasmata archaeon]